MALERYHDKDDDVNSDPFHRWNYWYFPDEDHFDDTELKEKFPSEFEYILCNSAYVRNLPQGYSKSGIICIDGTWVDLQDF